ncbi:hypothetical protein [Enterococcus olivae]
MEQLQTDILFRYVDITGGKPHYHYYTTANNTEFLPLLDRQETFLNLEAGQRISTVLDSATVSPLKVSSIYQDISIQRLTDAAGYNLEKAMYYVDATRVDDILQKMTEMGIVATTVPSSLVSAKIGLVLFTFLPAVLVLMSMLFYIFSQAKKNVLKKMDGYSFVAILREEVLDLGSKIFLIVFIVFILTMGLAYSQFKIAFYQYFHFSMRYWLIGILIVTGSFLVSSMVIKFQQNTEYIKGKAPKKAMYVLSTIVKTLFTIFVVFFLSMAIRNVTTAYNNLQSAKFFADKVEGYVTLPVYNVNRSTQGLEPQYVELYKETVATYDGVLIDASNYETDLTSGQTTAEEFNQIDITINENYLVFSPIYQGSKEPVIREQLDPAFVNILLPDGKEIETAKYQEMAKLSYHTDANFIYYSSEESSVYSYHPNRGSGIRGEIEAPVIIVLLEDQLTQQEGLLFANSSTGSYFIQTKTDDPYQELLPLLKKLRIEEITLDTPSLMSSFEGNIAQMLSMLQIYGVQSLLLSVGMFVLILFSTKLYIENQRKRMALSLVEGETFLSVLKGHLLVTLASYAIVIVGLKVMEIVAVISADYPILLGAMLIELSAVFLFGRCYSLINLHTIVKGEE